MVVCNRFYLFKIGINRLFVTDLRKFVTDLGDL